ncbi:MAG: hypothetical protein ACYTXT_39375 [Nostoc sp.]
MALAPAGGDRTRTTKADSSRSLSFIPNELRCYPSQLTNTPSTIAIPHCGNFASSFLITICFRRVIIPAREQNDEFVSDSEILNQYLNNQI